MKHSFQVSAKFSLRENSKKLYFSLFVIVFVISYPYFIDFKERPQGSDASIANGRITKLKSSFNKVKL